MHPARSLILFTTLSGLGFGYMVWLGLGWPRVAGWAAFWCYALAFGLAVTGLLASVFHLGRPERALRAFTQWRTSWLSREAWLATATLLVNGGFAALLVFWETRVAPLGWLGAILALVTVFATSMIYGQLRTVPRWHHWSTPAVFVSLALLGGALLAGMRTPALVLIALALAIQLFALARGDFAYRRSGSDMGTATGLGARGLVRLFEPPHTGGNYLTREMVFRVARAKAGLLRLIGLGMAFVAPLFFLLVAEHWITAAFAVLFHALGVMVLRWLFFAEAEHVVGLYYGRS